jgi:SecD/SecF fusion protein
MNVTLEVEMTGTFKDTLQQFKRSEFSERLLTMQIKRKANSDANFITLFAEEYKKLNPSGKLASLFANQSSGIKIDDSDNKVTNVLEDLAKSAFDNTFRILNTRIDQFGVAQPNINPDRDRGIITVELPGIQDKERVRKLLQSSANLQFWEVYNIGELGQGIEKADGIFYTMMGGKAKADSSLKSVDSTNKQTAKTDSTADTTKKAGGLAEFKAMIPPQQQPPLQQMTRAN